MKSITRGKNKNCRHHNHKILIVRCATKIPMKQNHKLHKQQTIPLQARKADEINRTTAHVQQKKNCNRLVGPVVKSISCSLIVLNVIVNQTEVVVNQRWKDTLHDKTESPHARR